MNMCFSRNFDARERLGRLHTSSLAAMGPGNVVRSCGERPGDLLRLHQRLAAAVLGRGAAGAALPVSRVFYSAGF